jgi:hypothetical protein
MAKTVPEFCDFDCPHAGFPPAETAGICRTMAAVWCGKLKEIVHKNAACEWTKRRKDEGDGRRADAAEAGRGRKRSSNRKR